MTAPPVLPPIIASPLMGGPPTPPSDSSSSSSPASTTTKAPPIPNSSAQPSPPASPKTSPNGNGPALPAPIGIPARRRASTQTARPSFLSSSPTHTPFIVGSLDEAAEMLNMPPNSMFLGSSLPARPTAQRSVSTGPPSRATPRNGTPKAPEQPSPPKTSPKAGTKGSPSSPKISKASPKTIPTDLTDINFLLANNSCLAEALAGGDYSAAGIAVKPSPKPRSSSTSKKSGWRSRLFDFDNVRGALDPSRIAEASAPEPVQTVVFGAETETGLVVCRALLAARHYTITALTVDDIATSPPAQELREQGVRVVQVDMDNPASYQAELKGAQAVYLSSNVITLHNILQHQPEPQRTEIARRADRCQLRKAVHACARAKVGHLIFRVNACGHDIVENSLGKKEVVNSSTPEDLKRLGVPHTVLHTSVPFSRLTEWLKEADHGLVLDLPVPDDTLIPWFAVEQTGEYVLAALRNPKKWMGRDMHAISDSYTPLTLAQRLSKMSRRPVKTMNVSHKEFDSLASHQRLTLRWDAWNQLVQHAYDFEHEQRATSADVGRQWKLGDWAAQESEMLQKLQF